MKTRVDTKGRVLIPKELRERLGLKADVLVSWARQGERMLGLSPEASGRHASEEVLSYLERLSSKQLPRRGRPNYGEISKAQLWLLAAE